MIKHGLRLRKKDDIGNNQALDDSVRGNKSRRSEERSPTSLSFLLLLAAILGVIAVALSLQSNRSGSFLKDSKERSRPDSLDTLDFADGLIQLHIPGLDKHKKTIIAQHHGPWTLQACSMKHGTKCPETKNFPLHLQIRYGPCVYAARWEAADATPLCGGGKAWQMTLPHQHTSIVASTTTSDIMMMIELNWFQSACLHGYQLEPWVATVELTVKQQTEESLSLLRQVGEDPLFVTQAAWRTTQDISWNEVTFPSHLFAPIGNGTELSNITNRITVEGAFVLPDAVVKPDPGYGMV